MKWREDTNLVQRNISAEPIVWLIRKLSVVPGVILVPSYSEYQLNYDIKGLDSTQSCPLCPLGIRLRHIAVIKALDIYASQLRRITDLNS